MCQVLDRTLASNKTGFSERRDQHRLVGGAKRGLYGERARRELVGAQIVLVFDAVLLVGVQNGLTEAMQAVNHDLCVHNN